MTSESAPVRVNSSLEGIFTVERAHQLFAECAAAADAKPFALVLDCRAMDDYTPDAREAFTQWLSRERARIDCVAIITSKSLWHMVIATMSLVTRLPMKPFSSPAAAAAWVASSSR